MLITLIFLFAFIEPSNRLGRNAGEEDASEDMAVESVAEAVDTNILFARPVFFSIAARNTRSGSNLVFKNRERRAQSSIADLASLVRSDAIADRIGLRKRRIRQRVSVSPRLDGMMEQRASDICCQESSVSGWLRDNSKLFM
jgi:hypothetical protein